MDLTEAARPERPDHVPADLFWDHSLEAFTAELDDPFLAASRLHQGPDIFWARDVVYGRPAWVFTRQALIQEALAAPELFSSVQSTDLSSILGVNWRLTPLEYDPPQHTFYRGVLNAFFTPAAAAALDATIRQTCARLVGRFEARGRCEAIADFAHPFPTLIFLPLLGLPQEESAQLLSWENDLLRSPNPLARLEAAKAIAGYLEAFIDAQRPAPRTELMKGLLSTRHDGRLLADEEVLGMLYTFYIAGLDTLQGTASWILKHLATDRALQARLRAHPEDRPRALDELKRAYSVVSTFRRVAEDVEFHGVQLREGDAVLLPFYLAARDPQAHDRPHEIDPDRQSGRLTFGGGPHRCLGAHLARRELLAMLDAVLSQLDDFHIPPGESCAFHTGVVFGLDRLPLAWTPRAS